MISTIHERPGVYSSYDVSSIVSGSAVPKTVGVAAIAVSGTANAVVTLTSLAAGVEAFGHDAAGTMGMEKILTLLFANGVTTVKAARVSVSDNTPDYASAFSALNEEEDIKIVVCDSASTTVQQTLRTALTNAAAAKHERIAVVGGSGETTAQMVTHATALNSERMVLVGPDAKQDDNTTLSAVFVAAAVAGVIAKTTDVSVPINGAALAGFGKMASKLSDSDIDTLVRGGVTPVECVGGVCSPVRGITTKTTVDGAATATWRELTTILIVDEVIPSLRNSLHARFAQTKNTAQTRGAIRSHVVMELEDKLERELIDSYGDVSVSALASDPTVCEVEFSFAVAHGLNRIYLTAHITV